MSEEPDTEDVAAIAARALANPEEITPVEVQSLAGAVLNLTDEPPPPPTYTEQARAELQARRDALKAKADKRRNEPGFARNVAEIDGWIAEIDAELAR